MERNAFRQAAVAATIVALITAVQVICVQPAYGQSMAMSLPYQQPLQASGDLTVYPECIGYTWIDDPSYYLAITVSLLSEGQVIDQGSTRGLGNAYHRASSPTTVGRSDRTIDCYLTASWGGYDELHFTYPARRPVDLTTQLDVFTYVTFGHYERLRWYATWDNYGYRYGYSGAPVTESFAISNNGCNLTIQTGPAPLNGDGEFEDRQLHTVSRFRLVAWSRRA